MPKNESMFGRRLIELLLVFGVVTLTAGGQQPSTADARVYVVGNVAKPMGLPLKVPTTLTQAISAAGGPLKDAKYDTVKIIRVLDKTQLSACTSLKAIKKGRAAI
jgi:protein involved in polysaccharide export with SLBB domain